MAEKVKTVIGCFFLLPDSKSRGHPTCEGLPVRWLMRLGTWDGLKSDLIRPWACWPATGLSVGDSYQSPNYQMRFGEMKFGNPRLPKYSNVMISFRSEQLVDFGPSKQWWLQHPSTVIQNGYVESYTKKRVKTNWVHPVPNPKKSNPQVVCIHKMFTSSILLTSRLSRLKSVTEIYNGI